MFYSKRYEMEVRRECEQDLLKALQQKDLSMLVRCVASEKRKVAAECFLSKKDWYFINWSEDSKEKEKILNQLAHYIAWEL